MFPYDNYALHLLPLKQASRASTPVPAALREAQLFEEFTDAAVAVTASGKPAGLQLRDVDGAVEPRIAGDGDFLGQCVDFDGFPYLPP